ncbi:hypothetical protein C8R44DRAFT_730741 [Mycena epipterygia]|nr:hypothetical protein C8R44DRAFT_730741 [Mycena epipterygia]
MADRHSWLQTPQSQGIYTPTTFRSKGEIAKIPYLQRPLHDLAQITRQTTEGKDLGAVLSRRKLLEYTYCYRCPRGAGATGLYMQALEECRVFDSATLELSAYPTLPGAAPLAFRPVGVTRPDSLSIWTWVKRLRIKLGLLCSPRLDRVPDELTGAIRESAESCERDLCMPDRIWTAALAYSLLDLSGVYLLSVSLHFEDNLDGLAQSLLSVSRRLQHLAIFDSISPEIRALLMLRAEDLPILQSIKIHHTSVTFPEDTLYILQNPSENIGILSSPNLRHLVVKQSYLTEEIPSYAPDLALLDLALSSESQTYSFLGFVP